MSVMQGGKFGAGALAGFAGSVIGSATGGIFGKSSNFVQVATTIAAGGIAGGVGSVIGGGKFWDGFRNGVIAAGLNHALHKLQQVKTKATDPKEKESGRNLTFEQAKILYQYGKGTAQHVDLSAIDLSKVRMSDFNERGLATIRLDTKHFSNIDDALVHGTITLQRIGNTNQAKTALNSGIDFPQLKGQPAGMFNFEMQSSKPINLIRNPATFAGRLIYSTNISPSVYTPGFTLVYNGGTPFPIYYHGTVTILK